MNTTINLDRNPSPGQTWQHFKGNEYLILAISGYSPKQLEEMHPDSSYKYIWDAFFREAQRQEVTCSETENPMSILVDEKGVIVLCANHRTNNLIATPHVIYRKANRESPIIWARHLDNFLSATIASKHENHYRFNRIS